MKQKQSKPLFFLFTCVKNGRKYINRLFDSLLNQTKINFVHFIYDDGSEEPLDEIVDDYVNQAKSLATPFQVIYEKNTKNIGLNMATQYCISKCSSDYFIWIDCDNWVDKAFFENLEKAVQKYPNAIMIKSSLTSVDEDSFVEKPLTKLQIKRQKSKHQDKLFFYFQYVYSFFAIKTDLYRQVNPNNFIIQKRSFFIDGQVICHCLFSKKPIVFYPSAIGYFLMRGNSESRTNDDDDTTDYFRLIEEIAKNDSSDYAGFVSLIPLYQNHFYKMEDYYLKNQFREAKKEYLNLKVLNKTKHIPLKYQLKNGSYLSWWFKINIPFKYWIKKILKR